MTHIHHPVVTVAMEDKSAKAASMLLSYDGDTWLVTLRRTSSLRAGLGLPESTGLQKPRPSDPRRPSAGVQPRNFLNVPRYSSTVFCLMFLQVTDGTLMESLLVEIFCLPVEVEAKVKFQRSVQKLDRTLTFMTSKVNTSLQKN